jgi:hypothetical protein
MARKSKRRARHRGRPTAVQTQVQARPAAGPVAAPQGQQSRVGGDQAIVRAVEMSLAPQAAIRRGGRLLVETGDPSIPLDKVPYFTRDLMQVGIVAVIMLILLAVGSRLIPLFVK